MKKSILLLSCVIAYLSSFAQTTQLVVGTTSNSESFSDVKFDLIDGGTIHVGSLSASAGSEDCYIVKLNAAGQVVWQKTIVNPGGSDRLYKVIVCANGDYVATGQYFINGLPRAFVCRINRTTGAVIWSAASTNAPAPNMRGDIFFNIMETTSGNIVAVGANDLLSGPVDGMIVSLNSSGVQNWARTFDDLNSVQFHTIDQYPGGELILSGMTYNGHYKALIFELNEATGAVIAQNDYEIGLSNPNPAASNFLNTLWPFGCHMVNGTAIFNILTLDGCCGLSSVQGIYKYDKVTKALSGDLFWHNGFDRIGDPNFFALTANDYIIVENIANGKFISRYTNGVFVYDREIIGSASNIYGIDVNGSNLVLTGSNPGNNGDGYSLFSTIDFPASTTPCEISNENSIVGLPNTPVQQPNVVPFINPGNVMTNPLLVTTNYVATLSNICGVICTPPSANIANAIICAGDNAILNATTPGATTYNWTSTPAGFTSALSNPSVSPIVTTVYHVDIGNGTCSSIFNVTVTVKPKSFTTINQSICEGQSYEGHTTTGTYVSILVAANGCDSVKTLNLTVKPKSFSSINQTLCQGQTYAGYGVSGTYVDTFVAANSCDSIRTLNLIVKPRSFSSISQAICDGQVFGGHSTTGTYVDTLIAANGCDSVRTLILTVKPKSFTTINQTICEGQSYEGHSTTGTYLTILVAANGCDSVKTLNLTVKPRSFTTNNQVICEGQNYQGHTTTGTYISTLVAANGCDSIVTLNLTVKPRSYSTLNQTICQGQTYGGYSVAGTYVDTSVAANGCDSIRTLNLIVKPRSFSNINQTICDGQIYGGHSTTGTYVDTLTAANGCDSVRTLILTVKPKSFTTINQTICQGQSYEGHTTTGTYLTILVAANGCDSVKTLNLTVRPRSFTTNNQMICEGQNYGGHTTTGTYISTFIAANGCDSVVTLNLTVKPRSYSTVNRTICQGKTYAGYGVTGNYLDTIVSANGCDSIRTLNLTVKPTSLSTINRTICIGQNYEGYTSTGIYIDTLVAANGCDSVRTLNLVVKPKAYSTINQTICQGNSYLGYTSSGTYTDVLVAANGCDSIRTLHLVVLLNAVTEITKFICKGQAYGGYDSSGSYTDTLLSIYGCDSVRTLHLNIEDSLFPDLGPDLSLCTGDAILLNPGVFDNYLWQNGHTGSHYVVNTPGLYTVTVTNSCGSVKDEIVLKGNECDIIFPNVFTPNNDGTNDVFRVLNAFNLQEYQLTIYNRWGQKIFETHDYTKGWDGTYKGLRCEIGTYVWHCGFKSKGFYTMKGNVTLIR